MKKKILALTLIFSVSLTFSQTSKKVCFLGNSYTYVNDMPGLIGSIANADGHTLVKDQNTPGGHTLNQHSTNATSLAKIASNTWDYVVLQDQSQWPSFPIAQTSVDVFPKAEILSDSIRSANECTIPLFYNTWGREVGDPQWDSINTFEKMNNRLFNAYDHMADVNGGKLSPVGIGFRHVFDDASTIVSHGDLYTADGSHPSIYGSYLAACIFYNVIFETTPLGNTYLPAGLAQNEADYLQTVAYHVVNDVDTVTIDYTVNSQPNANFSFAITGLDVNFSNLSENGVTYLWEFGDGSTSTDENPIHTYTADGNYSVILTTTKCGVESQITIDVNIDDLGLTNSKKLNFSVFPNPSTGMVTIKTLDLENPIILYSIQGEILKTINPLVSNVTVDLANGLYFVKQGNGLQKVIIE